MAKTQIVLPYQDKPTNGDDFDADVVRELIQTLADYLLNIPGGNLIAQSVLEEALEDNANPRLRSADSEMNFVYSGGLPGGFAGFNLTIPSGIARTTGYRHAIPTGSFTVAASKDTYYSVNKSGALDTSQAVSNGAAAPSLPSADSQWLFKAISDGSAITSLVDLRYVSPVYNERYVQRVSGDFNTASTAAVLVTELTTVMFIPAGRRVKVTAYTGLLYNATANKYSIMELWNGPVGSGTRLQEADSFTFNTANTGVPGNVVASFIAPTTGIYTFCTSLRTDGGGGTAGMSIAATKPAFMLVEVR